jgi:hypothetical protein
MNHHLPETPKEPKKFGTTGRVVANFSVTYMLPFENSYAF